MKNIFLSFLAKFRRPAAAPQTEAPQPELQHEFTLVTTDLADEIFLHDGDLITVDRSFVGFSVDVAMLRPKRFHALPIAHCESLREAEMLRALLIMSLAKHEARFDVRNRPRFVQGRLKIQESIDV